MFISKWHEPVYSLNFLKRETATFIPDRTFILFCRDIPSPENTLFEA